MSKLIDVDFQSKRSIADGVYMITPLKNSGPLLPNTIVSVENGETSVPIMNFSEEPLNLFCGEPIGTFSTTEDYELIETTLSFSETDKNKFLNSIATIVEQDQGPLAEAQIPTTVVEPTVEDPDDKIITHKFELGEVKIGNQLTEDEQQKLLKLIIDFKDVLAFDGRLGRTRLIQYQIDIDRTNPVHVRPYRVSPQQRSDIIKQAKSMLEAGIIEESRSEWNSPIILMKKSEEKGGGYRFLADFREINKKTKNWCYEIPLISDYLRSLAGYKLFCTLDANQGFYQVPIREKDKEVTSFIVPGYGSFQYCVMPTGAKCSPITFQTLMHCALGSF